MYSKSKVWEWGSLEELSGQNIWNALVVQVDEVDEYEGMCREATASGFLLSFFKSREEATAQLPATAT